MQWAFLLEVNLKLFLEVKQANESLVVLDPILVFRLVRTKTIISQTHPPQHRNASLSQEYHTRHGGTQG